MRKELFTLIVFLMLMGTVFAVVYTQEKDDVIKGNIDYKLSYTYNMKNSGPLNLTKVTVRLAEVKSWEPVQKVRDFKAQTPANFSTTDEYENSYLWYEYEDFKVNQSISLRFDVNLSLPILDYTNLKFPKIEPGDDLLYRQFMTYNPIADNLDPGIQKLAAELASSGNDLEFVYNAYNFSSTYIKYKLLTQIRGAKFALLNGYGDCDEYTSMFIALLRARNIGAIEHTAWLADFAPGFVTTDAGAAAHAYPMFYIPGYGVLPVDPTRGSTSLFNNWLKTDEKRITLTRGPDQPYRRLTYRWIPKENYSNPLIVSNYTIAIDSQVIEYFSQIRQALIFTIFAVPLYFVVYSSLKGRQAKRLREEKLKKMLEPQQR